MLLVLMLTYFSTSDNTFLFLYFGHIYHLHYYYKYGEIKLKTFLFSRLVIKLGYFRYKYFFLPKLELAHQEENNIDINAH